MIVRGTRDNDYGISREYYDKLYAKNEGFNREASRNSRTISASLDEVMLRGGKLLVDENPELVRMLLLDTAANDD